MLSGDNGILQRATDAKTKTERQSVIEQARIDVLGYQSENRETDLQKSQLQSVLEKYFKNVPDLTNMQDSEILKTKLDTLAEYGNHNIEVKEVFNGTLKSDNTRKTITFSVSSSAVFSDDFPSFELHCLEGDTLVDWANSTHEPIYSQNSQGGSFGEFAGSLQELILGKERTRWWTFR